MSVSEQQAKASINQALNSFAKGKLADNARNLFFALGYRSDKTLPFSPNSSDNFIAEFDIYSDRKSFINRSRVRSIISFMRMLAQNH
ncbi:hypothetical protein, partial [Microcoleus asticus]|uniref:hypothetical protein n=1 Tax=Microcoleus asticus TaxID=2815231 RepID=UPI001557722F